MSGRRRGTFGCGLKDLVGGLETLAASEMADRTSTTFVRAKSPRRSWSGKIDMIVGNI